MQPKSMTAALSAVQKEPTVQNWLTLIRFSRDRLDGDSQQLLRNHGFLDEGSALWGFRFELNESLHPWLRTLNPSLENLPRVAHDVIERIVARKTVIQCREAHTEGGYYAAAEPDMQPQWAQLIAPLLSRFDLAKTLELAPGHGRNSAKLAPLAKELHLVDVNRTCIDACRARFGEQWAGCKFFYYVNNGESLGQIPDESITFVYSFDSVVHFDKTVVFAYLKESLRILVPGGGGFIHHSNYGAFAPNSDWASNPGGRSDVSAVIFADYCKQIGLEVLEQRLHGIAEGRHMDGLDCVTLFRKPFDPRLQSRRS